MRALVGILGLALGVLVGTGLVLANPLAWFDGLPPLSAELAPAKAYRPDGYRGFATSAAELLGVGRPDRNVALNEPALSLVRIGIVVFPAGDGTPAALAVKVSAIADENSLWRAQLGTHDYWNIFWPGEGSVFASGYSNFWGLIRDTFFAAARSGDPVPVGDAYPVSANAPPEHSTGVVGAAGRYARFTGEVRESLYLAPPGSTTKGTDWVLALKSNPPPVPTR